MFKKKSSERGTEREREKERKKGGGTEREREKEKTGDRKKPNKEIIERMYQRKFCHFYVCLVLRVL